MPSRTPTACRRLVPDQLYGGVVFATNGMLFGLRPLTDAKDRFNAERVGVDHLSFAVASRDELDQAKNRLDQHGVEHGDVKDLTAFGIAILSFDDPDGVNLETHRAAIAAHMQEMHPARPKPGRAASGPPLPDPRNPAPIP